MADFSEDTKKHYSPHLQQIAYQTIDKPTYKTTLILIMSTALRN